MPCAKPCHTAQKCYGRGLTIFYHKNKKSCYAFLLNDDGDLKFIKIKDIRKTEKLSVLYENNILVKKGKKYELGVLYHQQQFFLFFNQDLIKIVSEKEKLPGTKYGVIAFGIGQHAIDKVTIFKPAKIK